jgi:hypothetical protein
MRLNIVSLQLSNQLLLASFKGHELRFLPDEECIIGMTGQQPRMLTPSGHLTLPMVFKGTVFVGILTPPQHLILPLVFPGVGFSRHLCSCFCIPPQHIILPLVFPGVCAPCHLILPQVFLGVNVLLGT